MTGMLLSRSASGMTTMKFLAPPSACTRLPACVARLVHEPRDRCRSDERHGANAGMVADGFDDLLAAVHQVDHARRQVALARSSSKMRFIESGTCSDGFRTNVLPLAIANGRNHSGTIAGKLNGAIAAHTPIGWRITLQSMPGGHVLEAVAHQQRRCAARHLDALDAAPHAAARLIERLAVLGRDDARDLVEVILEQLLELEHHARAGDRWRFAPVRERLGRGLHRRDRRSLLGASGVRAMTSPRAGLWTGTKSVAREVIQRPPMKCGTISCVSDMILQLYKREPDSRGLAH